MQFKNSVVKSLVLAIALCSSVYAAPTTNDCESLQGYLGSPSEGFDCKTNSNGQMTELEIHVPRDGSENVEWSSEQFKKIFSYSTIKKLTYYDEYSDCKELTYGISNLKNLEELYLTSFRGDLVRGALKDLTSLKKFVFYGADANMSDFSKYNIKELSGLSNLESLEFDSTNINTNYASYFKKLSKVTSLTLKNSGKGSVNSLIPIIKNLSNLKELVIDGFESTEQSDIDEIVSSTDLEKFTFNGKEITGKSESDLPISTNDRCGSKFGTKCPSGKCCSKYGWCGKSSDYCGAGCQSEFGKCN